MRRRDLIAGAAGLAVVGGGAAYVIGEPSFGDQGDEQAFAQFELPGIEAPGSEAGTVTVPDAGRGSFVELFATSCTVCQRMMPALRGVAEDVEEVQFISVTNEPIGFSIDREDVADWWAEHDGYWQLAHDDELALTRELNANMVPYGAVFDADNRLIWSAGGYKTEAELREAIEPVME